MSPVLGAEVVALHSSLCALTLAGASDIDSLDVLEDSLSLDFVTDLVGTDILLVDSEFPEAAASLYAGLGEKALLRLVETILLYRAGSNLNGGVAVLLVILNLGYTVSFYLYNSHRD